MTNSRSRLKLAPKEIVSNSIKERKVAEPPHKTRNLLPTEHSFFQTSANKSTIQIPAELIHFNEADRSIDLEFPIAETWRIKHINMEKHNSTSIPDLDEAVSTARNIQYDPTTAMRPLEGSRLVIVVFTLVFGLFLSTVETSITATALVSIGIYFGDSSMTSWVVLSYLLTYMGFSVIFARLSDAIGRKSAILLSWFLFAVFSLASGLATSLTQLIVFRSFQGIGGSGLFTMAMTVAPQVTPAKYWGALSGALGAALACSSLAGPVLGGVITQKVGWRWIYLYNAPIAVVMIIPFLIAWPKSPSKDDQPKSLLLTQIDVPGALLLLAASTLLVFALDQGGGYRLTWTGPIILSSLIVSAVCWVLFVGWISFIEMGKCKINIKPIFPLKSAIARPIGPAIIMSFLTGIPFFIVMINLPIRFQLLNGNSPTMAGVHLMPLLALSALGSAVGGLLSINKNRTYYSLVVASTLMCVGTGLLSRIPLSREIPPQQYLYQAILGFSIGLSLSSITVMTGLASDFASVASVNGAVNQARVLGGSIGLSVANIILNKKISSELAPLLTPTEIKDLRQSLSTIINLAPPKQLAVVRVFANSFNSQMLVCLYLSIAGFFIVHFTWQREPASVEAHKEQQQAMANN